jgi:aerobic carbon-monoxide dehydrogenase large subunit
VGHSPNWRRTACGSRARASDGAPIGASVTAIVAGCGAADTLGLPLGQVRVLHGSTPFLDEGYGAFASRSTVLGGSAVRRCIDPERSKRVIPARSVRKALRRSKILLTQ